LITAAQALAVTKQALNAWIDDRAPSMGAALSYYMLFSMAPLLLIVVSVAGLLFGEEAARGEIVGQLSELMGESGAQAIQQMLASVNWPAGGVLATLTGVLLMLIGATTVLAELQSALDHIWRAPPRSESGLWAMLRTRLLSFGLILGVGLLLLVSLIFNAALGALQRWWAPLLGGWELWAVAFNMASSFALLTAMFAMIYKLMPRVRIAWADVWLGAAVTALLFSSGASLIGLYVSHSAVTSGFGAAGSVVVLLIWIYYSAQIFLLGAEFSSAYAHLLGSRRLPV